MTDRACLQEIKRLVEGERDPATVGLILNEIERVVDQQLATRPPGPGGVTLVRGIFEAAHEVELAANRIEDAFDEQRQGLALKEVATLDNVRRQLQRIALELQMAVSVIDR